MECCNVTYLGYEKTLASLHSLVLALQLKCSSLFILSSNIQHMHIKVFHPVEDSLNTNCKAGLYMYEHICSVEASSYEEAFRLCQNDMDEKYSSLNRRSTSVGDILQSEEDIDNHRCQLVKGTGFLDVPNTWLHYIDWGAF